MTFLASVSISKQVNLGMSTGHGLIIQQGSMRAFVKGLPKHHVQQLVDTSQKAMGQSDNPSICLKRYLLPYNIYSRVVGGHFSNARGY